MKITVNDSSYIEYDKYNFTPFFWQKAKTLESGAHKGKEIPAKFVSSNKYFGSLAAAVNWMAKELIVSENERLSIEEFVNKYEEVSASLMSGAKKGLK